MKDLGFGLVDQRTVIIVLMTATLCYLFGLSFPLHTDNLLQTFLDLVFITGYLYVARSIIRLPFAFGKGVWNAIKKEEFYLEIYFKKYINTELRIKNFRVDFKRPLIFLVSIIDQENWKGFFGFIDRVGLILITIIITIPKFGQSLLMLGGGYWNGAHDFGVYYWWVI